MLKQILEKTFLQNRLMDYLICLLIIIIGVVVIAIFKRIVIKRIRKITKKTETTLDDFIMKVVEKTAVPLFYFIVFYLAVNTLTLDESVNKVLITIGIILLTLLGIYFIVSIF